MSPRTVFEEELSALKNNIQEMGQEVEKAYDSLLKAYGDERGIQSYGTVVDMLVAYYKDFT